MGTQTIAHGGQIIIVGVFEVEVIIVSHGILLMAKQFECRPHAMHAIEMIFKEELSAQGSTSVVVDIIAIVQKCAETTADTSHKAFVVAQGCWFSILPAHG